MYGKKNFDMIYMINKIGEGEAGELNPPTADLRPDWTLIKNVCVDLWLRVFGRIGENGGVLEFGIIRGVCVWGLNEES